MHVGIVGATGQVGGVVLALLAERNFPVTSLRLFASARSAGKPIEWNGHPSLNAPVITALIRITNTVIP